MFINNFQNFIKFRLKITRTNPKKFIIAQFLLKYVLI